MKTNNKQVAAVLAFSLFLILSFDNVAYAASSAPPMAGIENYYRPEVAEREAQEETASYTLDVDTDVLFADGYSENDFLVTSWFFYWHDLTLEPSAGAAALFCSAFSGPTAPDRLGDGLDQGGDGGVARVALERSRRRRLAPESA